MLRNTGNTGQRLCATATVFLLHLLIACIFIYQKPPLATSIEENRLDYLITRPKKSLLEAAPPEQNTLQVQPDLSSVKPPTELQFPPMEAVPALTAEPSFLKKKDAYQHLFDPRLREKLAQLKHFTKSKTRSVEGIEIVDLGGGICELTSLDSGSGSTGLPGSVQVKCGNNESEQMIENMEQALNDPLDLKN